MGDQMPSIKIKFHISADTFEISEVTRKIGVVPTKTRTKESFPIQSIVAGTACTLWTLETETEDCLAVSIVFDNMMSMLNGKSEIIKSVCDDKKLSTSFEVVVRMYNGNNPELVLPREVISFAASIGAEISFDLYCYD